MSKNNMLPRICRECGHTFLGGPRAWYCPICRAERLRKQSRDFKARKKAGSVIPLGTVSICPDCGKEFIRNSGRHIRCADCASAHLKVVDNQQSLDWKHKNPEKFNAAKCAYSKKIHKIRDMKKSGISGITWRKDCKKWRVVFYDKDTKKQIYIGTTKDDNLDSAKELLSTFLHDRANRAE